MNKNYKYYTALKSFDKTKLNASEKEKIGYAENAPHNTLERK